MQDDEQQDQSDSHDDSERWNQADAPGAGRGRGLIRSVVTSAASRMRFRRCRFSSVAHVGHSHLLFC
jgi:hypothetical protein